MTVANNIHQNYDIGEKVFLISENEHFKIIDTMEITLKPFVLYKVDGVTGWLEEKDLSWADPE